MAPFYVLVGIALMLLAYLAWNQTRSSSLAMKKGRELLEENATLTATLDARTREATDLRAELKQERDEKMEQQGKSKQLFAQQTKLEAQLDQAQKERDSLQKALSRHEEAAERRELAFTARLAQLDAAKASLDQERRRVTHEDETAQREAEAVRDRVWAEHEQAVIGRLTDLCKQPQYAFTCYANTNLPEGFDGSLKPDFMIEFLDQYVIFDAKKSKSESLQTYINSTMKTTATKVKKNTKIAPVIYLVVPSEAITELKVHHYVHDGHTFFVVSPESLAPILAALKRITTYEFAEQMDPQKRENIVQLIAEYDFHVNLRNAADLILTRMGTELLERAQVLDAVMAEEVALKKQPMNAKAGLAAAEIKRTVASLTAQNAEIARLVSPQAPVTTQDLRVAGTMITDRLP